MAASYQPIVAGAGPSRPLPADVEGAPLLGDRREGFLKAGGREGKATMMSCVANLCVPSSLLASPRADQLPPHAGRIQSWGLAVRPESLLDRGG